MGLQRVGHDWAANTFTFHFLLHSHNSVCQKKKAFFSLRVLSFHGASASERNGVWESHVWILAKLVNQFFLIILASTSKKIMLPCSCSWVESIQFSPLSVMLSVNVFVYALHYEDFYINLKTFLLANYESIFLIFREPPLTTTKPKSTGRKFKLVFQWNWRGSKKLSPMKEKR